jgi:protocatechuate 3,4-dioxygenase beta subunit
VSVYRCAWGLRLLEAGTGRALTYAHVDIWQADHEGRYSGFRPFRAAPGQVVTSHTVPRDLVAPAETFLRDSQRTDERGMCAFDAIYPGWYSSRTVHVHLAVRLGERRAITQLYFPDEITDQVFARPPYAEHDPRDTVNDTDSIFVDGGERTVMHLIGDAASGFTGLVCLAVDPHPPRPSGRTDDAGSR